MKLGYQLALESRVFPLLDNLFPAARFVIGT
jgi:hypothetical protein